MCGRFTLIQWEDFIERFGVSAEDLKPRYNIAPTQTVPIIVAPNKLQRFRWGLIPYWAKDKAIGARLINARAETIATKKSFRYSLKQKRCLVPADGFYEWDKKGKNKIPYRYSLKDGKLFAFAGLWDVWRSPDGDEIGSFSIITTNATSLVAKVHERMPVILTQEAEKLWLDPQLQDMAELTKLLLPYPAEEMTMQEVNRRVNSPANDDPAVLLPH